jgi:hypothetical protein
MKKILFTFSIVCVAVLTAFSQDDQYYTGDEATVTVKAQTAPPELPEYVQPACPYEGYLWTPGYWAWAPAGYYWVPGVWVRPPHLGYLWTPGYWGFYHGYYGWHGGYWGEHIGYYGGVNYGYGYGGVGFYGGRWEGGAFRYNTAVCAVGVGFHNTYVSHEGVSATVVGHSSFNGPGGVQSRPIASEQAVMGQPHVAPTSAQQMHQSAASNDKSSFASANHGKPATAAMAAPGGQKFSSAGHPASATPASHATNGGGSTAAKSQPASHTNNGSQQAHNSGTQRAASNKPAAAKPQRAAAAHPNGGGAHAAPAGGGGHRGK